MPGASMAVMNHNALSSRSTIYINLLYTDLINIGKKTLGVGKAFGKEHLNHRPPSTKSSPTLLQSGIRPQNKVQTEESTLDLSGDRPRLVAIF